MNRKFRCKGNGSPLYAVMTLILLGLCGRAVIADEAPRSIYVSAQGSDENNGRSEEGAYKTPGKAFSAASQGVVKRITVIGTVNEGFSVKDAGEIVVIGKDGSAKITGAAGIAGGSKIRIEGIEMSGGMSITGGAVVTLGKDVKARNKGIEVGGRSGLTLESNAEIAECDSSGIIFKDSTVVLKDGAVISNCRRGAEGYGILRMRDEAKIVGNNTGRLGGGVYLDNGIFTMSGNAVIEGNTAGYGGGIFINGGEILMEDNAAVTGNTAVSDGGGVYVGVTSYILRVEQMREAEETEGTDFKYFWDSMFGMKDNATVSRNTAGGKGGGIYVGYGEEDCGMCELSGNAVISWNKSARGGGIYYEGLAAHYSGSYLYAGRAVSGGGYGSVTMRDGVAIKRNSANEGGGVYVKGGRIQENAADYGGGVYTDVTTLEEWAPNPEYSDKRAYNPTPVQETGNTISAAGFTMSGGSVSGNAAEFVGGGVYQKTKEAFVRNGAASISENSAGDGVGGDIFIPE